MRRGHAIEAQVTLLQGLSMYLYRHLFIAIKSFVQLFANPVSTLMTVAVIGIALALPTTFHLVLKNAQLLSHGWEGAAQISLFLQDQTSDAQRMQIEQQLATEDAIETVNYISAEQALEEFKARSGFGDALLYLEHNPLPALYELRIKRTHATPIITEQLVEKLQQWPQVDMAQLDVQWVKKLHSIMLLSERVVYSLGALLALAVLLVIGNTIRLSIENRRAEIEVVKLVGGTDAFIRRPFLYTGLWYGFSAGILAWLMVTVTLTWLDNPVKHLAGLYNSQFRLQNLNFSEMMLLLMSASALGLCGSWLAVGKHLKQIEPTD